MTVFSNPAYSVILVLQLIHLSVDLLCNAATVIIGTRYPLIFLILVLIQDFGLILAVILIFLTFFNTYAFKAGLLSLLVRKFSVALAVSLFYFALTLSYHSWRLALQWKQPRFYTWNEGLQALYVLQRVVSVMHYYIYKRAAMRLGDSKYYEDSNWLRKHMSI